MNRLILAILALAFAAPVLAIDLQSTTAPGRTVPSLSNGELAINRADRILFFKNVDGTIGRGALMDATSAGRQAVEQGKADELTVRTTTVPGGRPLGTFLNAPDFATPDTYDGSSKGATTAYVQNFWRQRQGPVSVSPFDYCTATCGRGSTDDTAAVQAAISAVQAQQAFGLGTAVVTLRGGMFAVSAKLTMSGAPYNISIQDGTLFPFGSYSGDLFDLTGTTATTNIRFYNLSLNGYGRMANLIKLGPKTQGVWIEHCVLQGFTNSAIWDTSTVAGTEVRIVNNVIQGGTTSNVGTGIIVEGNDTEIRGNLIRNVVRGIRTVRASHTIIANHIYSISADAPIALLDAEIGDNLQANDNYFDQGYVRVKDPSGLQLVGNRWFGTFDPAKVPASAFNAIVLRPTSTNATWFNILITDNQFHSHYSGSTPYTPVKIDTTAGTVGPLYNVHMKDNGFYGYQEQTTEPTGSVSGNTANFAVNLAAKIPFGVLAAVDSVVCSFGSSAITSIGIGAGDPFNKIVYVGTAANQNGSCRVKATVNSN